MTRPRVSAPRPKPHEVILDFLRDNGSTGVTAATVATLTGGPTDVAHKRLEALVRRGLVVRLNDNGLITYRASTQHEPQGAEEDAR